MHSCQGILVNKYCIYSCTCKSINFSEELLFAVLFYCGFRYLKGSEENKRQVCCSAQEEKDVSIASLVCT